MRNALILCICTSSYFTLGGDAKYPVSAIPKELLEDVNAVIREEQLTFKILSRSKATEYVHQVITILNKKGSDYVSQEVEYGKLSKIKSINGSAYDATGKLIRKLKSNEIHDQSAFDGFSLFSDNRMKHFDLSQSTYPYTVDIEYELEHKYLFMIPTFYILPGEKVSVQHSTYSIQFPAELAPRYKTLHTDVSPQKGKTGDGLESITWTFENVKPEKLEPMGPAGLFPKILAAPTQFEFDGYVGNMSSWEEYGKWSLLLNNGRQELPEATKKKIKDLTNGVGTIEQKVKILYEYLQNKTRYVSIQEGIGGLQPFPANVVDEMGYGDCKALSNYMVALLKEAGVKGYYTRIRAGKNEADIMTDFPSQQSNHVIVAVPNGVDTLWLECTSQTNPFGYQGTFTGDRKALMVTEHGGKLVNTIRYTTSQNIQSCTAEVFIEAKGNAKANVRTIYSGLQYENDGLDFYVNYEKDEQKKWLQHTIAVPSFDINSFTMANKKDKIPSASVAVDLTLNRFATVTGKRLFLTPNLMNRSTFIPEKIGNRRTNVVRSMGYTDLDTIRYHLPEELYPEFLPEPIKVKSRFGVYEASFKLDQGSVVYMRKIIMNKGEFPPESYNELIEFYKSINKADNIKLVFLNKT